MISGTDTLGLVILPLQRSDPATYQQLCAAITAAVRAALLLERMVAEVERREKVERDRLEQEMAIAHRIQMAIFPKSLRVPGLDLSASMTPATEVGGDYFDVLPADDGCWLGIGDVVGHGLPTGLVAMMIQSIVAAMTRHGEESTSAELWRDVNAVLVDNVRARMGQDEHATLSLIRYWIDGRLKLAGSHEPVVVLRSGAARCETVLTTGIWAGITLALPPAAMEQLEIQLDPGDLMLLFTDGLTEARNTHHELFGLERLCARLKGYRHQDVHEIRRLLLGDLAAWSKSVDDDVTLVVARYHG